MLATGVLKVRFRKVKIRWLGVSIWRVPEMNGARRGFTCGVWKCALRLERIITQGRLASLYLKDKSTCGYKAKQAQSGTTVLRGWPSPLGVQSIFCILNPSQRKLDFLRKPRGGRIDILPPLLPHSINKHTSNAWSGLEMLPCLKIQSRDNPIPPLTNASPSAYSTNIHSTE